LAVFALPGGYPIREEIRKERKVTRKMKRIIGRLVLTLATMLVVAFVMAALTTPARSAEPPVITDKLVEPAGPTQCWEAPDIPELDENANIQAALLAKAHKIEDCTVTWYTADTCSKRPGAPAYGITYSGLPVVEHLTCAVDPDVIPLYSDVFVEYADGSIEQLWATDTGVTGNALDIYTPDYDYAMQCGRQSLTVWWVGVEVTGQ